MKGIFKFNWELSSPTLSKQFKVFGSLCLLLSFSIQSFYYNSWEQQISEFEQANRDFTEMTRTSLEYQNLYLALQNQDSLTKEIYQPLFIKAAAEKYRLGKIISTKTDILNNEKEVKQFVDNSNALLSYISQIDDFNSLYAFVQEADQKLPENRKLKTDWFLETYNKKKNASRIFLIFQILGSIMIVFGYRYQK